MCRRHAHMCRARHAHACCTCGTRAATFRGIRRLTRSPAVACGAERKSSGRRARVRAQVHPLLCDRSGAFAFMLLSGGNSPGLPQRRFLNSGSLRTGSHLPSASKNFQARPSKTAQHACAKDRNEEGLLEPFQARCRSSNAFQQPPELAKAFQIPPPSAPRGLQRPPRFCKVVRYVPRALASRLCGPFSIPSKRVLGHTKRPRSSVAFLATPSAATA